MINFRETTLAELVNQNTGAAAVFGKYALDFCCKGKRTLEAACEAQGLDADIISMELETVFSKPGNASLSFFQNLPIELLADYIVERHHRYVREVIPHITAHVQKVADRHGEHTPSLVKIAELWQELAEEMTTHMFKEEKILFPLIKRMAGAMALDNPAIVPPNHSVGNPIRVMEMEHDRAGELMSEIRKLSNDFTPPLVACTTYRLSFRELQEFEADLHRHVHLENHLLFPKAMKLEEELLQVAA